MATATREAYGNALGKIVLENPNVVVMDADLSGATKTGVARKACPERYINMGIAEGNMVTTAAGIAASGKTVFCSSFAIFAVGRAWEQLRNSVCYPNLNVKVCATHAGISVGEDGASHQALEDIATTRVIPNLRVYQPCDAAETEAVIRHVANTYGPCYVRLGRAGVEDVYPADRDWSDLEKVHVLNKGEKVAVLTTGFEVQQVLKAKELLAAKGINPTVVDIACIKPLDEEGVVEILNSHDVVITVEEHNVVGGFGSAICEVACTKAPKIIHRLGMNDVFGESGPAMSVVKKYGLDAESLAEKIAELAK